MSEAVSNVTENTVVTEKNEETKAEKFVRLGEYRMNKVIDAIGRLENLSNKSSYEYTEDQVEAMFSVLESKVAEVKQKFTHSKSKGSVAFSFGDMTEAEERKNG